MNETKPGKFKRRPLWSNMWPTKQSWKKFLIRVMVDEAMFMIYPNFPDMKVMTTNHALPGEHRIPTDEAVKKLSHNLPIVNKTEFFERYIPDFYRSTGITITGEEYVKKHSQSPAGRMQMMIDEIRLFLYKLPHNLDETKTFDMIYRTVPSGVSGLPQNAPETPAPEWAKAAKKKDKENKSEK